MGDPPPPSTSLDCGTTSSFAHCCELATKTKLVSGEVLLSQVMLAGILVAACIICWIVLKAMSAKKRFSPRGKYIVLAQTTDNGDGDGFNSQGEDLGIQGGQEPIHPQQQTGIVTTHFVLFSLFSLLAFVQLGTLFIPFSPAVHVLQILLYQLRDAFPLFYLGLLFLKDWNSKRGVFLSLAVGLVFFGLSVGIPIAISRAVASTSGAPHIDVVLCENCPLYFFANITLLPTILYWIIWIIALVLVVRKRVRASGNILIIFMVIFLTANVGPGAAIAGGFLPDGVCVGCVFQLLYMIGLPIILTVTIVRDSALVGAGGDLDENGSGRVASAEDRALLDSDNEHGYHHEPTTRDYRGTTAPAKAVEAKSPARQAVAPAVVERAKPLTEAQKISKYLLDNLEESVKVVEFDQVVRERKIGAGGFGEVFKGSLNGEEVAIKRVLDIDEKKAKTFLREINTMSRLQHPNITILVGVAISQDDCYLLTEYVKRGSLFDLIHGKKKKGQPKPNITWANVITVLRGTACGMSFLHSMDPPFLHRDLKSQNLLIGDNWLVKICDFGMARVRSLGITMTKLGTLQWVAPEVLRDERYSEKADIYSFSILIWELVAKAVPYVGQNSLMVARAVAYKSLRPVIPHTCPDMFRDLMTTCWQDDADKRPSFKEILAVLDNIDSETANAWPPLPEANPQKK